MQTLTEFAWAFLWQFLFTFGVLGTCFALMLFILMLGDADDENERL